MENIDSEAELIDGYFIIIDDIYVINDDFLSVSLHDADFNDWSKYCTAIQRENSNKSEVSEYFMCLVKNYNVDKKALIKYSINVFDVGAEWFECIGYRIKKQITN